VETAAGGGRHVQRLHDVLPHWLPGHSKERRAGRQDTAAQAQIDPLLCTGCEVCAQVCARHAILFGSS